MVISSLDFGPHLCMLKPHQGEVRRAAAAALTFLKALAMIHTTAAFFTTWQEGLETVLLHIKEGLINCVFGNDFIVIHGLVELVLVDILARIEDSFSSNTTRVSEMNRCVVKPFLNVVVPIVEVGN